MTNFDFLLSDPQFTTFGEVAVAAEKIYTIDPAACVLNCRRCMEFAVKWMYSVDGGLVMPYDDRLASLMDTEDFRAIVDRDLWQRLKYIRQTGNAAAHKNPKITPEQARLCLENLWYFMDYVSYCYGTTYTQGKFDPALLEQQTAAPAPAPVPEVDLAALMAENEALRAELTARREAQQPSYTPKPLDLSEYKTRKLYIDAMLTDAGWTEGKDWLNEVELPGMPNKSEVGYADYVLYDDAHRPLAVIEAKRTCVDPSKGRQQAKLYADLLEQKYGRRPVIFLTNGFDTRIDDGAYPERRVAAFYSKRDLEKLFNLRAMRTSLKYIQVDHNIAGRYYQEGAIKSTCQALAQNRRKALLVMATGSGKTRTVIALVKVLLQHGWVKNVLFLADRNSLVTQAKRSFVNLLPDLSVTNLCEEKDNYTAHCVFSTYQTMMNCIDSVEDGEGKLFTVGHFDLVICDEAHRSIYNKYWDIFNYFDAPLVGLTATPKDEIDKNTYEVFELESGVPTYGYELAQAVKDGFLVDFLTVESKLKFLEEGISYADLSEEEKAEYEATFTDENGELPERIESSALNEWLFNEDTIRLALNLLMTNGLKIDYGEKLGKTIIFAKNHRHAEKILEVFSKEYPHLPGYAKVIDNYMTYAQSAIDEFSDPKKLPQIAISVDMLDTGIDVPEVLNLVFFKKVMSKAKFWQMIGRGTRLCPGLIDGEDKTKFYIFDLCGNFEFFRMNKGKATANQMALQSAIFYLKAQIVYKLQDLAYQTQELIPFREKLVEEMLAKVQQLDRENFAVRQHLRYVEKFTDPANYQALSYEDTLSLKDEVAPLLQPDMDEASAVRFDALMYGIELAYLVGKTYKKARKDLVKKVSGVASVANIPEIRAQSELIEKILHTDYLDNAGINEFEHIRECLRNLMKYLPHDGAIYNTNFTDDILSVEWKESELENDDLKNYKAKAEFYVRQHQDKPAIAKLRSNVPLTAEDVKELESILWSEVGTRQDYEAEVGQKPLGEFVREIVGMDMNAAKEAFAQYLNDVNLDSRQIYFVNQIVEYIVHNGVMKDLSVLQEPPFTDRGSIVEIFTDLSLATRGIKVNLDNLKIDFRSIVYQYREEDGVVAELIAYFDEKIRIHIYLSSEISFATIEASGQQIKNKAAAKKLPDIPLYIMPQIGLIREDEKRLSPDTVKAHMHTRLSSRHFRNELLLYREYFEEFRESAQMSWPGLRITNLDIDEERIELIVYDADFAAEIGQMGSGLQMWLQMVWYISRCPVGSTIVLDEPDVYMHPDLQQKIFKIVQRKFRQVIIATHSVEIISLVEPKQIVTVDKRSRKMQYADSYQAVQDLVDNLGGMNNLSLIRLGGARKCVFVEGKDLKLLSKFHELLYPDSNISLEQLPTVSLGGWSRFDEALGAARLFYDQTNGEFKTICILDRDYHFDEEIAELYRKAEENHLNLHVWEKKEIENYILTPQSIFRLIEQPQETYPIFLECLSIELEQLKQQTLGGFMDQLDRNCRGQASSRKYQIATAELEKRWGTLEDRLSVCNGKDLISHINSWVARQYHQKSSRKKLLDSLTAEDICDEMKQVISDLIEK